jgi:Permuted papain-like amidase enzyme, YaeF/YiiX, C92 family
MRLLEPAGPGEPADDVGRGAVEPGAQVKARCRAGGTTVGTTPTPREHNGPVRSPGQVLAQWFVEQITRPRREYRRVVFNDPKKLKSRIRPSDVVLVDGDQRVSQVVKYLTMSPWSHSAIYIGSSLLRNPMERAEVRRRFGREARYLIVEALVDQGVVVSPLVKYIDFNIRVCRPVGLTKEQIGTVLDYVISRVGYTYDRRNVFDLFRYLLPVHLIPMRLREEALHFGSGKETETICSSLLAEAFTQVGFSILPMHIRRNAVVRGKLWQRFFGRPTRRAYSGFLRTRHPSLCVPQDFDLSPHFDVVKFNAREPIEFDHVRQE